MLFRRRALSRALWRHRGVTVSTRFRADKRALNWDTRKKQGFHQIRATVRTMFAEAGVPTEIVNIIQGWSQDGDAPKQPHKQGDPGLHPNDHIRRAYGSASPIRGERT